MIDRFFNKQLIANFTYANDLNSYLHSLGLQIIFSENLNNYGEFIDEHNNVFPIRHNTRQINPKNNFEKLHSKLNSLCASQVSPGYTREVIQSVLNTRHNSNYDIVFLSKGDVQVENIIGFMIVERGECKRPEFIDVPVLNLICCEAGGFIRILMFLYVYTMKYRKYPIGLLELAGNYNNIAPLCVYNKFGFRESIELKSDNPICFKDGLTDGEDPTLSMIVNLEDPGITEESLLAAVRKSTNITLQYINTPEPLCGNDRRNQQSKIIKRQQNLQNIMTIMNDRENSTNHLIANNVASIEELGTKSKNGENVIVRLSRRGGYKSKNTKNRKSKHQLKHHTKHQRKHHTKRKPNRRPKYPNKYRKH